MNKTVILPLTWLSSFAVVFFIGSRLGSAGYGDSQTADSRKNAVSGETSAADSRAVSSERRSNRGVVERLFGSGSTGWESLVEKFATGTNPTARNLAFHQLLVAMTPENAFEIRERFVELSLETDSPEWIDFHYAFGAMCGREAFDIAVQYGNGKSRALWAVMSGWAAEDPSGALAEFDQLQQNYRIPCNSLAASLITGVATKDLQLATDMAQRLIAREKGFSSRISYDLANQVILMQGVESAATWAESLPDDEMKGTAIYQIASSYRYKDPQAAAAWVGRIADQDYAAESVKWIASGLFSKDKAAALSWLESLPDGKGRAPAFEGVISSWAGTDFQAAAEYVTEMPDSPTRDSAIRGFASRTSRDDPVTAIEWADSISDPAIRQEGLINAASRYLRKYPAEALDWLPTSGLSEEAQQKILSLR